jgi:hypothetical protein
MPLDEIRQVESERGDVLSQFLLILLEGHEQARFCELGRASHEKFHAEERFPATGATGDKTATTARQSAAGDFIETGNAGRRF